MHTQEIVIYKMKKEKLIEFKSLSKIADTCLSKRAGFISRKVLNDQKDETIFLDIVEWETLENAETAAKEIEKDPDILPFFEAAEKVISFNHYIEV